MEIQEILEHIYPLPEDSRNRLIEIISEERHPKGYQIICADKVERNIYFIKEGIVRAYTNNSDNEVTFWFGQEGDPVISIRSYVDNKKGYENIELLEDGVFYKLNSHALNQLFLEDIHIANWGRKFSEHEMQQTEKRLIMMQSCSASERYAALLKERPTLVQRVQLSYIASYLGITQVSLSRIRAKIR